MADPHNVEFEAAKFLQKLIHESTDEPAKLATKLYVILQHMKASGKENTMPYQVISRAMETVINQHGLDIEALMSSRLPMSSGSHGGESSRPQPGCSQAVGVATDSKSDMIEHDTTRPDGFGSGRPPAGPSSMGNDPFQGSASQRSAKSFDHESPSSMDTRSTNSYSQDRREPPGWEQQGIQKDVKKPSIKRKRSDASGMETPDDITQQLDSQASMPDIRKERLTSKSEAGGTLLVDPESWKQGFFKGAPSFRDRAVPGHISPNVQVDVATRNLNSASSLDSAGISNIPPNADRLSQGGNPSNLSEVGALGSSTSRDTGKFPAVPSCATGMPFKEHHLKQLRAQCLVFLAFRNGLSPKRLHLEIALGNILVKEGSSSSVDGAQNEPTKDKGKQHSTFESSSLSEVPLPGGNLANVKNDGISAVSAATVDVKADLVSKEAENAKLVEKPPPDGEKKQLPPGNGMLEDDTESQETANSSALMTASWPSDTSGMRSPATLIHDEQLGGLSHAAYVGMNKQLKPDMMRWSRVPLHSSIHHDLGSSNDGGHMLLQRENNIQNQQRADGQLSTTWKSIQGADIGHHRARPANDSNMLLRNALHDGNGTLDAQTKSIHDGLNAVPMHDSSYMHKDSSAPGPMDKFPEPEEEEKSTSENLPPSPKLTLSEKWIMAHQKRKLATQQEWVQKLQKADQRISTCFVELKETVSSSADISAKTRSVIELKKLQLLELQRCLRSNILNDFFKPIQTEMDRLKSIKKHRIGRRLKHVEKYEQKMKEERQKRIRERQKEFFSEVEVHKERLEDVFKFKRERCKGFNRYVKEFHKRKERIHREKIDRIQREKINLLKINDVEGYLRMVQDAKSDRVKQLLKETEKYLTKLGSKLKEAKAAARQVEMDENRIATIDESNDIFTEAEDENDQAKHYKESNEKYYLIAHSIKESIAEQPTGLRGGKLREYQMNGLRWLVSLYNNHLNGILADEMGLGKTVQVISLICYLMENKNDRGPFLVVVPSSVLPGWEQELSFWAPGINKIVYAGPPEERRRLFKECIIHQKFNVLLTTYEYLMNKHDRPKLSKLNWHYIIIDEGHRIKNASCKLNADLKLYHSSHRLLLTGTPLQNNLEELWALLNFLLPNIFNSSEDFSQWFNKPFESNGDASPDQALLSEEENLLIINRLHQVLRPFVLRRLKHKVENELPEKIERLVRCEASAYQKLLMKRVEENLGALGVSKARAVHNSVMELRNICNHPYLSQLHAEEVDNLMPKHFLPPIVRLCGKLEMLDRLLPKLKATNHRVLFFSTMTRLLDVMEEYLVWKQYRYLRLDGHTSGLERGALIEQFNRPDSPFFIFLLSIRAGGVGVNLQAADTVIIFDTDWNPQVDLQAQARAHRIGQKKDVLVLRLETVHTVEEQVRASAEHKLGVANQSITAGFFDNNTSAEDRREYLESLLREPKKEEAAPVLDDDSLNDILARSESEIDAFEEVDQKRREEEMATWKSLVVEKGAEVSEETPPLPSRLVTEDDLKAFYEAMKIYEIADDGAASGSGMKRKGGSLGGYDTQQYGRGKRAREVRSYEEQWTEEEFEKICQAESPETPKPKDEKIDISVASDSVQTSSKVELSLQTLPTPPPSLELSPPIKKEITPTVKRGRGRPKRMQMDASRVSSTPIGAIKRETQVQKVIVSSTVNSSVPDLVKMKDGSEDNLQVDVVISPSSTTVSPSSSADPGVQSNTGSSSIANQPKRQGRKGQPMEKKIEGSSGNDTIRRRGRKTNRDLPPIPTGSLVDDSKPNEQAPKQLSSDVSVSTNILVGSGNVLVKGSGGPESKSLEAGTGRAVVELKDSELARKQTSFETSSITAHPVIGTEKSKINSLLDSDKASAQESAAVPADAAVQDPKQVESPLLGSSQASAKKKGDPVSQDEDQATGSLSSSKSGTKPNEGTPLAANPSSESAVHSPVGLRPGRRQSQKPQSGIEPVRRRGRKRGRIVSTDSAPLEAKDNNLNDSVKSTSGPYISAPSEPAKVVTGSHLPAVPVIPLVPVSGFTLGSGLHVSLGSASGSSTPATLQPSPFLSGTPAIPPETLKMPVALQVEGKDQRGEAGEKAPRRRGRKKSAASPADNLSSQYLTPKLSDRQSGDFVDRKVITTRSRQSNISQASNIQEEANLGITPTALTSKGLEATQSPILSSHAVASSSVLQPASMKADAGSKPQQSRRVNSKEEIALCRSPAEIPPVSCKGKTNVIVLALDFTGPALNCREADSKKGCSELQKDLTRNVKQKVEVSELEVSCAAGVPVPNVDEELSAPPGFDTPRAGVSDSAVRKSSESYNGGKSKSCVAKSGSVVLALESTKLTIDPCGLVGQKLLEKEKSSVLCEVKDSGKQSDSSSMAIRCEPPFVSADALTTGQTEEEISAPPGFDIPQRCITDKAAVSSKCDDDLVSDKIPDSAQKSKVEEHPEGTDVGEVDAAVTPFASSVFISDTAEKSSLELKVDKQSQGPDDCSSLKDVGDAAATLGSKDNDLLQRPNDDTSEVKTNDTPAPSCVLGSDTTTVSILDTKGKEECQGPRDVNVEFVVGEALPDTETASTLKSTEKENYDVSDDGSAKVGAADASATLYTVESGNVLTASCVERSNTEPLSSSELKENEECYGHGAEHDAGNAPTTLHILGSYSPPSASLESLGKEVSHENKDGTAGHNAGTAEHNAVDAPPAFDGRTTSTLESKKENECLGPDSDDARHEAGDTLTGQHVSDIAVSSRLELEEKEDCDGPHGGKVEPDATDTATASHVQLDSLANLTLETSHGVNVATSGQDASDAPIATCVIDDPCTSVSILEEKEQDHDDVGSAEQDDMDAHTASCVIGTDSTAASTPRANEQEEYHGIDVGNAIHNPNTPPASFVVGTDSTATVTLAQNALLEQYEGTEVQSAKLDATDPATSCTFETGNTCTTLEQKEGDEHQRLDVADAEQVLANALTASCGVGIGTSTASTVEEKKQEKSHGFDVTSAEQDPAYASLDPCVVGISITTAPIVDEKEQDESHELDVGNSNQGGDVPTSSCPVVTDTSSSVTLAERDQEEHHDFDNTEQDADNVCPSSCAVDMDGSVAPTVKKQEQDHQEMGVGNAELLSDNTPSACYVASSDATAASTMKENNQEHELDVNARQAANDALQASFVVSSDTIPASTVEQHVQDHLEQSTDIAPTNSFVSRIGTASTATLEENDLEEQHGLNVGGAKEDAANDSPSLNVVGTTTLALTLDENDQGHQDPDVGVSEHGAKNGVIDSFVGSDNADAAILEENSQEVKHDPDVGYAEQHADNAPSSCVATDATPASNTEEKDREECHVLDLGDAEQYVDNAPLASCVVGTDATPTSILVENERDEYPEPNVGDGEKDAFHAPIGSCVVGFDTATASTVQENDQEEDCGPNVGNAEQHGGNAPPASCVGTDTTPASTLEENDLEECHDSDVGIGELQIDDAPSVSCVVGIDAASASTLVENDQDEHHESDVSDGEKDADNALTGSCVVCFDTATAATLLENEPKEHQEPDVGNAEQHADNAPSASGTDTTLASMSEENDQEECHGIGILHVDNASSASRVVGIDATPASTSVGNDQDENHEPDVGDAKNDANSAPTGSSVVGSDTAATLQENDQEEHHEPDVGNAEQHGDNDPPASCVGADTTLASTSEENDQEECHDLGVSNDEQQTDNAPSASCVVGVDATSASTLVEKDQEEHHELDVGDAKKDADNAPTGSCVVGFDTATTATLQENDQGEHHESDIGNAEQHADNAPLAACDAGTGITPPSIIEQNNLGEHHEPDVIYAEHGDDIAPAVSCIVGTVTATTETPEEYNEEGHHGLDVGLADENVGDVHADSFVNTDTTAASGDASKASCGVQIDTNAASGDASKASCGVQIDTNAASGDASKASCGVQIDANAAACDTPTASTVCMDNSSGSGVVPAASCVLATDTATALTSQDKNQDSHNGLDVLTEQNVGDVHATSCVVTTDATAAFGDASTASCCVSPVTITASFDTPTASFTGTDNIMESGDVPSASCVVATDSTTPLTLEDKGQVAGSGCTDGKSEHVDHDPSVASGSND